MARPAKNEPAGLSVTLAASSSYAAMGYCGHCPECGASVTVTDEPSCPQCGILLTVAPAVAPSAIWSFISAVVAFGMSAGAWLFAIFLRHVNAAEGGGLGGTYPLLVLLGYVQFAFVFHGVLVALGLLERASPGVLRGVLMELAIAWGLSGFILFKTVGESWFW